MPTDIEPSEPASGVPKPFLYFLAGLGVGAICVLLPLLCVLPLALHSARSGDQLQAQSAVKDAEIARLQLQLQAQTQNRPPPGFPYPPPGYPPPPPPRHRREPRFGDSPDAP